MVDHFKWWVDDFCAMVANNLNWYHFRHHQTDLPKQIDLHFRVLQILLTKRCLSHQIISLDPSFNDIKQTVSLFNQKNREIIFFKLHDKFRYRLHRYKVNDRKQDLEEHILLWNNLTKAITTLVGVD